MDLRERIASLMGQVRPELTELVAIRSVADPRQLPPEECARAAQWVLGAFADAGFSDARLAEMAALRPLRRPAAAERGRLADPAIRANRDGWALVRLRRILMGVEEPLARIHAPNESVDPAEIAAMALTEALFLQRYARIRSRSSQHDPA